MKADSDPGTLGFDAARLSRIQDWMQRYVDEGKFPGSSVLIARNGNIAWQATAGLRSVEQGLAYQPDTIVRIYSMTKPVTSVALMMLAERGLFHLDAPIDRYLPEFSDCHALIDGATRADQTEPAPPPTLHQLLTHTSGLSYGFNTGVLPQAYAERGIGFGPASGALEHAVKEAAQLPLAFQPGARWEYSIGIDIIGRIIEIVSGSTLDVFFQNEILGPLGMEDTGFTVPETKIGRFASCYTPVENNPLHLTDEPASSEYRAGKVTTFSGGGGLVSTLSDYFRFAEMLRLGGSLDDVRLLSPRTTAFMKTNHLAGDIASMGPKSFAEMPMDGIGFGIGGSVALDPARARSIGSVGDFSWGGMASTLFWIDPIEHLSVVFFTQLIPSNTYPNRPELKALVHAALVD